MNIHIFLKNVFRNFIEIKFLEFHKEFDKIIMLKKEDFLINICHFNNGCIVITKLKDFDETYSKFRQFIRVLKICESKSINDNFYTDLINKIVGVKQYTYQIKMMKLL